MGVPARARGRYKNVPAEEIKKLFESGVSCGELANKYNMSRSAIYRKLGIIP